MTEPAKPRLRDPRARRFERHAARGLSRAASADKERWNGAQRRACRPRSPPRRARPDRGTWTRAARGPQRRRTVRIDRSGRRHLTRRGARLGRMTRRAVMEPKNGTQSIVDLAERHSQDLDVFLMWGTRSGRLWVRVTHRASGTTARIEASAWNALDVFNHPFAYAEGAQ